MGFEPSSFRLKIKCCVTEPSVEIHAIQLMCGFLLCNLSSRNSDQEMQQFNVNSKYPRLTWCVHCLKPCCAYDQFAFLMSKVAPYESASLYAQAASWGSFCLFKAVTARHLV